MCKPRLTLGLFLVNVKLSPSVSLLPLRRYFPPSPANTKLPELFAHELTLSPKTLSLPVSGQKEKDLIFISTLLAPIFEKDLDVRVF